MNPFEILEFNEISDQRGGLIALEQMSNIPFEIKRVYYIYGTPSSVERGFHAHKELKQVAICLVGNVDILMDDGLSKAVITLDSPAKGLRIDEKQWHEMRDFSHDCVLMVLASDYYDESDYIRDYSDFIQEVRNGK